MFFAGIMVSCSDQNQGNETEKQEVLKYYKKKKKLDFTKLGRGSTWLDTGTGRNNLLCSNFIQIMEEQLLMKEIKALLHRSIIQLV